MSEYADQEPTVRLADGSEVTEAIYSWCADLIGAGHTIVVDADGHVRVSPPCNPDVLYCLGASWRATRSAVADLTGAGWTVQ